MADRTYKQNDYGFKISASLAYELADGTSTPVTLAAGDTVKFYLREYDSLTSKLEVTATKEGGAIVSYTFAAGDLNTPGRYRGEWEVTFASPAKVQTFPSESWHDIVVLKDLGPGA